MGYLKVPVAVSNRDTAPEEDIAKISIFFVQ